MEYSHIKKSDMRECLAAFMKNRNKGVSFDEWKNKKNFEICKSAQIREAESCIFNSFDRIVQNANKISRSDWLKTKNAEAKKIVVKQRIEDFCCKKGQNEFEALKKNLSKKAFKSWLKNKKKETNEKDLRIKKDEAYCNLFDDCFFFVKSEYNKKAMKDWLHYLKARQNKSLYPCHPCH